MYKKKLIILIVASVLLLSMIGVAGFLGSAEEKPIPTEPAAVQPTDIPATGPCEETAGETVAPTDAPVTEPGSSEETAPAAPPASPPMPKLDSNYNPFRQSGQDKTFTYTFDFIYCKNNV